jgi:hypothetical protein
MVQLADIQRQAKELSEEDRESLVAYLLHGFSGAPSGPGAVLPISHDEFLAQVVWSAT